MAVRCAVALAMVLAAVFAAPLQSRESTSAIPRKALAGPPEEFASHSLPDPIMGAIDSESMTFVVQFANNHHHVPSWSSIVSVDSSLGVAVNVFLPLEDQFVVSFTDPQGNAVPLEKIATPTFWPVYDSTDLSHKGMAYNLDKPIIGDYKLTISSPTLSLDFLNAHMRNISSQKANIGHGYVVVYNAGADRSFTHLMSYSQQVRDQVGLVSRMYPSSAGALVRGQVPTAIPEVVEDAELEALFPDGHRMKERMHDDGLHGDGAANDGIFGASFEAYEAGQYIVQAMLKGKGAAGPFLRSTTHFVEVLPRMLQLTSTAFGDLSDNILNVYLEVDPSVDVSATFRPYFQLWGSSETGEAVPVAWISSLENVEVKDSRNVLALQVDTKWIARANAVAPFTLRDVYVQDVRTWIPLSRVDSISLTLSDSVVNKLGARVGQLASENYDGSISLEMMQGVAPAPNANATNGGKLILLHGYCAEKNPFAVNPGDWTDNLFFLRSKVSMPHDEYAQRVVTFANENGLSSYGLVGHSQGGIVTLHSLNYYFSGLDAAVGPRKIQSLASPYNGNSAAGNTADLGKLFGLGCGPNFDMTVDGATLWMAGISANALNQANYYTTQYDKGGLFGGGWCNMLTNALLNKPNDGTTEMKYATLNGGNHRSHVIGQCHIDGMNWPASYFDHARNAEMNSQAAR